MSNAHYDQLETRDPAERERALFKGLPELLRHAVTNAPGWSAQLKDADLAAVTSRGALAKLPVLRKSTLKELQAEHPPFGGFATSPVAAQRI